MILGDLEPGDLLFFSDDFVRLVFNVVNKPSSLVFIEWLCNNKIDFFTYNRSSKLSPFVFVLRNGNEIK